MGSDVIAVPINQNCQAFPFTKEIPIEFIICWGTHLHKLSNFKQHIFIISASIAQESGRSLSGSSAKDLLD